MRTYKPNLGKLNGDVYHILKHFPLLKNIPIQEYYNGKLSLEIDPTMDTEWGYCMSAKDAMCPSRIAKWEIAVAGKFPTRRRYLLTLVHELFHLYQMTVLGLPTPNHGKRLSVYMSTTAKRQLDKMLRNELSAFRKHYAIVSEDYQ